MRTLIICLIAGLSITTANAQKIHGLTKDSDGKPLSSATVSLVKDTQMLKLAVTDANGNYSFTGIPDGAYKVIASYIGFKNAISAPIVLAGKDVMVAELILEKSATNLEAVMVASKKPIIEVKADKMILNVEGTINATGTDALELLRKSPGVMVDKDDNLSVNGKNGVQVYVDGRPSPLSGQDLSNYLKTLQSAQIEAIEIITNPSARYEAAGNAGIINIRLKKNKAFGTNGSVNAGLNLGFYPKYNTGISLNHRNRKINIYGNYNYNDNENHNRLNIHRQVLDSLFDQGGTARFTNNSHNFKAGIDYTLSKKSSVAAMINGSFSAPTVSNYSRTPIIYMPDNTVDRILVADNKTAMKNDNTNINLNYIYSGKNERSLVLNADYGRYDLNTDQYQPNYYYSPSGNLIGSVIYQMISPTEINISSFKSDYEQNFAKGKLSLGSKIAVVNTDNDFRRFNVYPSGKELDKDRSNLFKYDENINAGYVNYNRSLKGVIIQAGLRVENTVSEGRSHGQKDNGSGYVNTFSGFKRNYTDFFPSAAMTFNKNPMKQWNFTYSRRIDRPAYQDLNPFEFKLDEYTFQKGNTELKPQYTNSFGITHTYKFKLNTTLNYSHVKDIFTMLIDTVEQSKAFVSKKNLATQDIVSVNISYPFMYKNFMSFVNLNSSYSQYNADFGNGRTVDLDAFGLSVFSQNSLKFGKTKTWTAELSGFYNAPTVWQGAFKSKTLWAIDMGIQKQVLKGKGTIKGSVSDVFNTLMFRGQSDFAGQQTNIRAKWETQQFKLNFNFRFGNNQVKAVRQRNSGSEEESKRVQQGGGIGIGQ